MIKVSVIMTTYNAETHIRQSLDSVFKQSLKDIEVVVVDGNSSDNTLRIVEQYRKEFPDNIALYMQGNRNGIGGAKNLGIESAKGEYITFLDSDDYYVDETALEKMYLACKEHNVDICGGLRSELSQYGEFKRQPLHRELLNGCPNGRLFSYKDFQYDYHFHSYLYNREKIINSDAIFPEIKAYEDPLFHVRAMHNAKKFFVVPVELYCYRAGSPYDWGQEKANDAMRGLIDQLLYSKKEKLEIVHWVAAQRIQTDYEGIWIKNILAGDMDLLKLLVDAHYSMDCDLLEKVIQNPPNQYFLESMSLRGDLAHLERSKSEYAPRYILRPLKYILDQNEIARSNEKLAQKYRIESENCEKELAIYRTNLKRVEDNLQRHMKELTELKQSESYRIGKIVAFVPGKLKKLLRNMRGERSGCQK